MDSPAEKLHAGVEGLRRAARDPARARSIAALESMGNHDLGGVSVCVAPNNRVGGRYPEVTEIGSTGKRLK